MLTRTCVASTWPPKAPSDAWKRPPWALWEERVEEVSVEQQEEVSELVSAEEQWEAEVQTPG